MEPEPRPVPDPSRALVPPVRRPPTAVATADRPDPDRPPHARAEPASAWRRLLRGPLAAVNALLDVTDVVVDRVAEVVGLRGRAP